jgi:lipopolysaccharide/colanic/teichoic acid biosynthesis glycosyltransferase
MVYKFRTMVPDAEKSGARVTVGGDPRITRVGHILRKYKLDELPQLINVLKGEMSLVGPRPEVAEYVTYYSDQQKNIVHSVPPGITDPASIEFRNENKLLSMANDPEQEYIQKILPRKIEMYVEYVIHRSLWIDLKIILRTLGVLGR